MEDRAIRTALDFHWAASNSSDFEAEHQIYREDMVLECPQSGERNQGRQAMEREGHPPPRAPPGH